jgi:hypothetical protein
MQSDKNYYRGVLAALEGVSGKKAVNSDNMTVKNLKRPHILRTRVPHSLNPPQAGAESERRRISSWLI